MSPELRSFKNIVVIQTAFLGDVALVLPLGQLLKTIAPETEISLITTPAAVSVARCVPAFKHVIAYDKRSRHAGFSGIRAFAKELAQYNFDCVIAPHRSFRTSLLSRFLKPRFSVGFKSAAGSFLYSKTIQYPSHLHEIERNFSLLKAFKNGEEFVKTFKSDGEIAIPENDIAFVEDFLVKKSVQVDDILIALAPGSVWATKRWQSEHFAALNIKLLKKGFKTVLIGGREDRELCAEIAGDSGAINAAGEMSLPQTLALLKRTSALACNDSAPTHLAGLVKCPVVTIFGPTSPIFGFAPRGEFAEIIQNEDLQCRPCEIHGGRSCPIGTHECMKSITPEVVLKTIDDVFKRKSLRIYT